MGTNPSKQKESQTPRNNSNNSNNTSTASKSPTTQARDTPTKKPDPKPADDIPAHKEEKKVERREVATTVGNFAVLESTDHLNKKSDQTSFDIIPLDIEPDKVQLGRLIGEGVYSTVYRGSCYGTEVAVKVFKNQGFEEQQLNEVRKEVRIQKSIRHPNLLLFLGACTKPGHFFIVTELMDKSFNDLNKSDFTLQQKLWMAREAAKAMSWLHSLNPVIIHRDLKPENILIDKSGKSVKVADFGLSLVKDYSKTMEEEQKRIRGSPAFMSPEALLGEELDPKTDVYAFALILWEIVSRRQPYESLEIESFDQLIEEICVKGTREVLPKDCPPALSQLIQESWSTSPLKRPSFIQVIHRLEECVLEVAISDADGRKFWKSRFFKTDALNLDIEWRQFAAELCSWMGMDPDNELWEGLKFLILKGGESTKAAKQFVRPEDLGKLLSWFGPMEAKQANNFLTRVHDLYCEPWFHGAVSTQGANEKLQGRELGSFLIRFSSQPGAYALSKLIEQGQTVHVRIEHTENKFKFTLDNKIYAYDSLQELVKEAQLGLKTPCPSLEYRTAVSKIEHNPVNAYTQQSSQLH